MRIRYHSAPSAPPGRVLGLIGRLQAPGAERERGLCVHEAGRRQAVGVDGVYHLKGLLGVGRRRGRATGSVANEVDDAGVSRSEIGRPAVSRALRRRLPFAPGGADVPLVVIKRLLWPPLLHEHVAEGDFVSHGEADAHSHSLEDELGIALRKVAQGLVEVPLAEVAPSGFTVSQGKLSVCMGEHPLEKFLVIPHEAKPPNHRLEHADTPCGSDAR